MAVSTPAVEATTMKASAVETTPMETAPVEVVTKVVTSVVAVVMKSADDDIASVAPTEWKRVTEVAVVSIVW